MILQKAIVKKVAIVLGKLLSQTQLAGILVELSTAELNENLTEGDVQTADWLLSALLKESPAAADEAARIMFAAGQCLDKKALAEDLAELMDQTERGPRHE